MPPAEQVRAELDKILSSEVFGRSGRARDLLRYIVEQDLAGNADRLKGYSIGVDVFGKGTDFDPANDTVVRVQMGRLRDFLKQYYLGQGADDALRISIPLGTYAPNYAISEPRAAKDGNKADASDAPGTAATQPLTVPIDPPRPATPRLTGRWVGLSIAALAFVAIVIASTGSFRSMIAPVDEPAIVDTTGIVLPDGFRETTGSVPQEALPSVFLDVAADEQSQRVAAVLRRGIAGFDTVNLIARASTPDVPGAHARTDFAVAVHGAGDRSVLLEVQNVLSGKVLYHKVLEAGDGAAASLEDQIADALSTIMPASGILYASIVDSATHTRLVHCLVLNDRFYREQRPDAHRAAYECLEEMVAEGSTSALVYSEIASLHVQAIHSRYAYPEGASREQALEFARKAVQYGPGSPYAHRSMGYVLSRTASPEESLRWTQKAYELNTFDLGMAASYGYALVFAGDYARGTPILARAVKAASAHPTWWDYGLFLGHLMNGDDQAAADAVSALAASNRAHYIAARAVAAHALGQKETVDSLVNILIEDHKSFSADPMSFYRDAKYPVDMCQRLTEILHDAGLGGAS